MRTYRAFLFRMIKEEHLMYEGEYFKAGCDIGAGIPMLEMAGDKSRFIDEILYIYNVANPTRDGATKVARQVEVANYIRSKERYQRIESV